AGRRNTSTETDVHESNIAPSQPDEMNGVSGAGSEVAQAAVSGSAAHRLALNTAIVGGAFVLSRVLGLVREAVIAGRFGTSPQYDAYVVAFRVPDTLFLLIVGGAVGSAFIPVFTGLMSEKREREAWQLA